MAECKWAIAEWNAAWAREHNAAVQQDRYARGLDGPVG